MVLELQSAERVGNPLQRVRQRVRVVVHRVDAPRVARSMMRRAANPVQRRIAHVQVGRGHVDLRPQHVLAVFELAGLHAREQIEVLLHRAIAIRAVAARFRERASVCARLISRQFVDVCLALPNQLDGELIQLLEIIRRVEHRVPRESEPGDVLLDRVDVLDIFFRRIGVVEPQIARAATFGSDAEIEADRFGVPDVEIPVRLRRKSGGKAAVVLPGRKVLVDDRADEIDRSRRGRRRAFFRWRHGVPCIL